MMETYGNLHIQEMPLSSPFFHSEVERFLLANGLRMETLDSYFTLQNTDGDILAIEGHITGINDVIDLISVVDQLLRNRELLEAKRSLAYNWATGEAKVLDGIVEKIQGYMEDENA